ncbi:hypothetical protein VULLAG_LOCUS5576 [Vulpes lagopus]
MPGDPFSPPDGRMVGQTTGPQPLRCSRGGLTAPAAARRTPTLPGPHRHPCPDGPASPLSVHLRSVLRGRGHPGPPASSDPLQNLSCRAPASAPRATGAP